MINLNESVTWRAKHFGIWQTLATKITAFDFPYFFSDEMVAGPFHYLKHEHHFKFMDNHTLMTDYFEYISPLGNLGRLADVLFLKQYMWKLLMQRNNIIKKYAESELWKQVLQN